MMNNIEFDNIIIQYDNNTKVDTTVENKKITSATITQKQNFKATIIVDKNISQNYYGCYKITVGNHDGDKLVMINSTVTKIISDILLPCNRQVLIIIGDSFF